MNYLFWLLLTIWLPSLILWQFVNKPRSEKIKGALKFGIFALLGQLVVEHFIIRYAMNMQKGHYLGIRFFGFPLEDFLFFLTISLLVFPLVYIVDDYFS